MRAAGHAATDDRPRADERPLTVRMVDRLGRALAGRDLSRRRFLGRVAIAGTALTVAPLTYLTRPGTAYANVCGEGASCGSGWTAFCCTINSGANTCPPGSFVAGWWRIDDSPFCFGQPRYVIDCNRLPNASCRCTCASGSCDRRRVCCNNFRYGQYNTQIPGVTEVVCRVVVCTPPWEWDPACGRTVRVDNRTRTHNAPCLPGRDATPIDIRYQDLGQTGSILGAPTTAEMAGPSGGRLRRYDNGSIHWLAATGAVATHGAIDALHRSLDGAAGDLRYPTAELAGTGDGRGLAVRFQRGTIYRRTATAEPLAVPGPIDAAYRDAGGPTGTWGYPTSSQRRPAGAWLVRFDNGDIWAWPGAGPAVRVRQDMLDAATAAPESSPDHVGWPVAAETTSGGARLQRFEHGIVVQAVDGTLVAVGRDLADRYLDAGGPGGSWGRPLASPRPVAGGRGRELELQGATLWVGPGTGTRALWGPVLAAYLTHGGASGTLGLPTSDPVSTPAGQTRASFQHGALIVEPTGTVTLVTARSSRSPHDLARTTPDGAPGRRRHSPSDLAR